MTLSQTFDVEQFDAKTTFFFSIQESKWTHLFSFMKNVTLI